MVTSEKWASLHKRMAELQIFEHDLREQFVIGSGKGGQKLHKTASCVNLLHIPTGFVTKCQRTRSRDNNRYYARKYLCEKIEQMTLKEKSQKQQEIEKIRRQKRRRSAKAKKKMLEQKKIRSEIKRLRSTSSRAKSRDL